MKIADGFIVCYSINSRALFNHCSKVRSSLLRVKNNIADTPIILVSTKCDLENERVVQASEGMRLAEEWESQFFETSAKENKYVAEPFAELVARIDEWRIKHPPIVETPKRSRAASRSGWRRSNALSKSSDKIDKNDKNGEGKEVRGGCVLL